MTNEPVVTGAPLGRAGRIALVGGGLMVASGILGAILGTAFFTAGVAIVMHTFSWTAVAWGAERGAVIGGIVAPLGAWAFLRRVPLGLAIPGLTVGTIVGGTIGSLAPHSQLGEWQTAAASVIGFVIAAVVLRLRNAPPPATADSAEE
jgi:hypothetical protein